MTIDTSLAVKHRSIGCVANSGRLPCQNIGRCIRCALADAAFCVALGHIGLNITRQTGHRCFLQIEGINVHIGCQAVVDAISVTQATVLGSPSRSASCDVACQLAHGAASGIGGFARWSRWTLICCVVHAIAVAIQLNRRATLSIHRCARERTWALVYSIAHAVIISIQLRSGTALSIDGSTSWSGGTLVYSVVYAVAVTIQLCSGTTLCVH